MRPDWISSEASGTLLLHLHVQPGARSNGVAGLHGQALKIRLTAPATAGRANAALLAFLAERLEVPKNRLELVGGAASRDKRVRVSGLARETVVRLLLAAAQQRCS